MPRAAITVAEVFRRYGDTFRAQAGAALSTAQRRVMTAIEQCRTAALGGHVEQCDRCGHRRVWYNSCRNRHCPTCQSLARAAWLERRRADLLPTEYFHVVFTVPPAVAEVATQNKAVVYGLLFRAVAETLRTIAADPRHLGAEIGFFAVLHTWGQTLVHHPHLHCVIPGGGLATDGSSGWVACRPGFFLPVRVLSRYFRRVPALPARGPASTVHPLAQPSARQPHPPVWQCPGHRRTPRDAHLMQGFDVEPGGIGHDRRGRSAPPPTNGNAADVGEVRRTSPGEGLRKVRSENQVARPPSPESLSLTFVALGEGDVRFPRSERHLG